MKNGFDTRKFGITTIIIILIVLLCFGGYYLLGGKENTNEKPADNPQVTPVSSPELGKALTLASKTDIPNEDIYFDVGDSKILFKKDDKNDLYINGVNVGKIDTNMAYVCDDVVIFVKEDNCGMSISYVIDKNGKSVSFTKVDSHLRDLRTVDGEVMATGYKKCECIGKTDDSCPPVDYLVFYFNGSMLNINKYS